MSKNLYFRTPLFRKNWETKIVNDLECYLYRIVGNEKFYANDKMLITVNPKVTIVMLNKENAHLVKTIKDCFCNK